MFYRRSNTFAAAALAIFVASFTFTAIAAGDAAAGKALFTGKLGCYGCHGQAGGGGMGPSLADKTWTYGGDEASITETLQNGRPGGMPAFGAQASKKERADVVAFVISLSAE